MKVQLLALITAVALSSAAVADDHLVQATLSGGLIFDEQNDAIFNKAGHQIPDTAPGQGSPFIGEHQCTPASDNGAAHANVKPRGPDAGDCEEEE